MASSISYEDAEAKMRLRGYVLNPKAKIMLRDFYEIMSRDCNCLEFEEYEYTDKYGSLCTYKACRRCGEIFPGKVVRFGRGV